MIVIFFNVNTVAALDITGYTISPSFRSMQGDEISNVLIGHPVIFNLDIHNNRPDERSDVIIIEVRDADTGFTHYLGWQTFAVHSNSDYVMTLYWIPSESGEYVLRTFVMDGLALGEREALSIVHKSKLLTVDSDA